MVNAKELGKGDHFKHQNDIWRVLRKEVVTVGTHSHSKTKLITRNLLGGGEKSFVFPHEDNLDSLDIKRKVGHLISKADGNLQVMDMVSYETLDASCSDELTSQLNEGDDVIFVNVENKTMILEKKMC